VRNNVTGHLDVLHALRNNYLGYTVKKKNSAVLSLYTRFDILMQYFDIFLRKINIEIVQEVNFCSGI